MNKIELYKEGILSFNKKNEYKKFNIIDLSKHAENYDYLIGILFLTEMNRYCKENKFTIHGYYVTQSLINIFIKIANSTLKINDITNLYYNISSNINYINDRANVPTETKNKINGNLSQLIIEITPYVDKIYTNNCLNDFFYVLLTIAKYIGTGDVKNEPNLFKLSEYYAGIFNVCIKIKNTNKPDQLIFEEYITYKNKLKYSIEFMKINTERIDEILDHLNDIIKFHFESKM
jgi:hypothetical protein